MNERARPWFCWFCGAETTDDVMAHRAADDERRQKTAETSEDEGLTRRENP